MNGPENSKVVSYCVTDPDVSLHVDHHIYKPAVVMRLESFASFSCFCGCLFCGYALACTHMICVFPPELKQVLLLYFLGMGNVQE